MMLEGTILIASLVRTAWPRSSPWMHDQWFPREGSSVSFGNRQKTKNGTTSNPTSDLAISNFVLSLIGSWNVHVLKTFFKPRTLTCDNLLQLAHNASMNFIRFLVMHHHRKREDSRNFRSYSRRGGIGCIAYSESLQWPVWNEGSHKPDWPRSRRLYTCPQPNGCGNKNMD